MNPDDTPQPDAELPPDRLRPEPLQRPEAAILSDMSSEVYVQQIAQRLGESHGMKSGFPALHREGKDAVTLLRFIMLQRLGLTSPDDASPSAAMKGVLAWEHGEILPRHRALHENAAFRTNLSLPTTQGWLEQLGGRPGAYLLASWNVNSSTIEAWAIPVERITPSLEAMATHTPDPGLIPFAISPAKQRVVSDPTQLDLSPYYVRIPLDLGEIQALGEAHAGDAASRDPTRVFFRKMKRYYDEGTVYASPTGRQFYAVSDIEQETLRVTRLGGGQRARVGRSEFNRFLSQMQAEPGGLPLSSISGNRANKATWGQHDPFTIGPDGKSFVSIDQPEDAEAYLNARLQSIKPPGTAASILRRLIEHADEGVAPADGFDLKQVATWMDTNSALDGSDLGGDGLVAAAKLGLELVAHHLATLSGGKPMGSDALELDAIAQQIAHGPNPRLRFRDCVWKAIEDPERRRRLLDSPASEPDPSPPPPPRATMPEPTNRILYGPPGTGKTYATAELAVELCDGDVAPDRHAVMDRYRELVDQQRVAFVTFHQSYAYEDFVEGIRPVLDDTAAEEPASTEGAVRFECRPGVFRRICARAQRASASQGRYAFDPETTDIWKMSLGKRGDVEQEHIYEQSIEEGYAWLGYGGQVDYSGCTTPEQIAARLLEAQPDGDGDGFGVTAVHRFKNGMRVGDLVVVPHGNLKYRAIGRVSGEYQYKVVDGKGRQTRAVQWLHMLDEPEPYDTIARVKFSQMTIYRLKKPKLQMRVIQDLLAGDEVAGESLPHVLVIDEINRANVSKVLGELITLLEPDKRLGQPNEIRLKLPYSGEEFGVPSNLHVVGTMNTADRSIAFLDTALRRRFRFKELMPDSDVVRGLTGQSGVVEGIDVADLMDALNRRIEAVFDRDHQLGHAYFLGINTLEALRDAFRDRVIPLLQEYFYEDWSKVALVLGCPYPEHGAKQKDGATAMIRADAIETEGEQWAEWAGDAAVRCTINPRFLAGDDLPAFFTRVLHGQPES